MGYGLVTVFLSMTDLSNQAPLLGFQARIRSRAVLDCDCLSIGCYFLGAFFFLRCLYTYSIETHFPLVQRHSFRIL